MFEDTIMEFAFCCKTVESFSVVSFNWKRGREGAVSSCILMFVHFLKKDFDFNNKFQSRFCS